MLSGRSQVEAHRSRSRGPPNIHKHPGTKIVLEQGGGQLCRRRALMSTEDSDGGIGGIGIRGAATRAWSMWTDNRPSPQAKHTRCRGYPKGKDGPGRQWRTEAASGAPETQHCPATASADGAPTHPKMNRGGPPA